MENKGNKTVGESSMNYNYHTHTYRCHHAEGTPEEYIKRAIECGVKHMGFSEHIPFKFADGYESRYRLPVKEAELYFSEISALCEKYKDEIDIKIGFEMEYYPAYYEEMFASAKKYGAQYLILGQHFINQSETAHEGIYVVEENNSEEDLKEYVRCTLAGMKKGVFSYVAHPDVFNFTGDENIYKEHMEKICVLSKELFIPLEINFWGIKKKRFYPNETFWEMAGEIGSPVTFGFDAHETHSAFDDISLKKARLICEKYNLNYIGKPEMVWL